MQWLTGLILHVAIRFEAEPHRRTLAMVHEYASLDESSFHKLLYAMSLSPQPLVRRLSAEMKRAMTTQEGSGILSGITKGTMIVAAGSRAGMVTSRSDFRIEEVFVNVGNSLFLQVPVGGMAVYAGWLRMMVGLAHHASVTATVIPADRPLFLLDEAATLGEMKELQETVGQGRAYHQKLFIYQDMAQLKAANRGWQSVVNNCHINMAFAVNDLDTAEYLSRRLGEKTVATRSMGVSGRAADVLAHHANQGQGEQGRRLMMPNEILHMDPGRAVVSIVGLGLPGPVAVERIRFYREPMFRTWCERDPVCPPEVLERVFPQLASGGGECNRAEQTLAVAQDASSPVGVCALGERSHGRSTRGDVDSMGCLSA